MNLDTFKVTPVFLWSFFLPGLVISLRKFLNDQMFTFVFVLYVSGNVADDQ